MLIGRNVICRGDGDFGPDLTSTILPFNLHHHTHSLSIIEILDVMLNVFLVSATVFSGSRSLALQSGFRPASNSAL